MMDITQEELDKAYSEHKEKKMREDWNRMERNIIIEEDADKRAFKKNYIENKTGSNPIKTDFSLK